MTTPRVRCFHPVTPTRLLDLLVGRLSPVDEEDIENHLSVCTECGRRAWQAQGFLEGVKYWTARRHAEQFRLETDGFSIATVPFPRLQVDRLSDTVSIALSRLERAEPLGEMRKVLREWRKSLSLKGISAIGEFAAAALCSRVSQASAFDILQRWGGKWRNLLSAAECRQVFVGYDLGHPDAQITVRFAEYESERTEIEIQVVGLPSSLESTIALIVPADPKESPVCAVLYKSAENLWTTHIRIGNGECLVALPPVNCETTC